MHKKYDIAEKENSLVGYVFPENPETISVPMVTGIPAEDRREEVSSIFSIGRVRIMAK